MRSVYVKILLWSFGTLVLSLVAFVGVSAYISYRYATRGGSINRMQFLELDLAREAYETGGVPKLEAFIAKLNRYVQGAHYLTDSQGRDLITGVDHSALLTAAGTKPMLPPAHFAQHIVVGAGSEDGRYNWLVVLDPPLELKSYLPYYLLILVAVALILWVMAIYIASPLRSLARAVDRFGSGDLSARVNSTRKDEIGELSRAFDRMAERLGTLLTAERRLLQDISHELRSPLARLSFAVELARTAVDREAATARITKEIERLTALVGALIQVTRAEGDPSSTNPESLRLNEVVEEVVADCQVEAGARGCRIALAEGPELAMRGDRELLRRAIENVVRNSIRYAPGGSAVDVRLYSTDDTARICVRDYGPGVPEEALPKIFQPFFRVDDARESSTGGVGLGLAIAGRAIGLHHGKLWAQNALPGLMVWIELPLAA